MVLCLAMMLSIMVVGAGAAFVDQKDIDTKHTEAVDMCSSLNIITGFENGKFMPNDNVTREQMAKMICVLDNGGKEPQLATGNTFSDVAADRWSNKYIESCASRGVVVGIGGGKFAPAGKVTATQAAKMLLVELGYDDDSQKYSGSNWATQVNIDATAKGYYDDLEDIDVNAPLTREHAAQMIWNALQATEVEYSYTLVSNDDGSITSKVKVGDKLDSDDFPVSLLDDKYGTSSPVSIMTGAGELSLTSVAPGEDKFETYINTYEKEGLDATDLIGKEVKVIHKYEKGEDVVYGVFATDKNTVKTGTVDQLDKYTAPTAPTIRDGTVTNAGTAGSVKLDGKTLKLDPSFKAYDKSGIEGQYAVTDLATQKNAFTIEFIDNDDDGKYDIALIDSKIIGQVASANTKTFTVKTVGALPNPATNVSYQDSATLKFDYEDEDIVNPTVYDGMAKDDFVVCSYNGNNGALVVEPATVLNQLEITTINSNKFTVDGSVYKTDTADATTKALVIGDTADFVVYGNYIYTTDEVNSDVSASDYVVVLGSKSGDELDDNLVKVLYADGTTGLVTAKNTKAEDGKTVAADVDNNKLVRYDVYTIKTSGEKVKFTKAVDEGAFDKITEKPAFIYNSDNNSRTTLGSYRIADDAVILYLDDEGDPQMMSGKTLQGTKTLGTVTNAENASAWADEGSNGVLYVKYAWLGQLDGVKSGADKTLYAYVVDSCGTTKDGDDTVATIIIASGDDESTTLICSDEFDTVVAKPAAGDFIKYEVNNEGKVDVDTVKILTKGSATTDEGKVIPVAITGVEGDSAAPTAVFATVGERMVSGNWAEFVTDEDTLIIYVDTQEQIGGADVGVTKAGENESGYIKNAYIVYEVDDSEYLIKALYVESDNDITAAKATNDVVYFDSNSSGGPVYYKNLKLPTTQPHRKQGASRAMSEMIASRRRQQGLKLLRKPGKKGFHQHFNLFIVGMKKLPNTVQHRRKDQLHGAGEGDVGQFIYD